MTIQYDFDCFVDSLFLSLRALFITSTTYSSKTEARQRKRSTFRGGNDHVTLDLFSWRLNQQF